MEESAFGICFLATVAVFFVAIVEVTLFYALVFAKIGSLHNYLCDFMFSLCSFYINIQIYVHHRLISVNNEVFNEVFSR